MNKIAKLSVYMPEKAAVVIARWIDQYQVQLKITRPRSTKLGDYRHPYNGHPHRISVNADLNPYAFLVTLIHEFAHLVTWNHHGNRVKSHGKEWKQFFRRMMQPFFEEEIFPDDIRAALARYLENPAAASCTDLPLMRTLRKYDRPPAAPGSSAASGATASVATAVHTVAVEQLPEGTLFKLKPTGRRTAAHRTAAAQADRNSAGGIPAARGVPPARIFRKGVRLRKRYRCVEVATGRVYLFNPLAEVVPVNVQ